MADEIRELIEKINAFRDERDWRQFHTPKDLAISVSLEASELLECFQWKDSDSVLASMRGRLAEELADVVIYALMLCDDLGFDVKEIVESKLAVNAAKYPIDRAKGRSSKYTELG